MVVNANFKRIKVSFWLQLLLASWLLIPLNYSLSVILFLSPSSKITNNINLTYKDSITLYSIDFEILIYRFRNNLWAQCSLPPSKLVLSVFLCFQNIFFVLTSFSCKLDPSYIIKEHVFIKVSTQITHERLCLRLVPN